LRERESKRESERKTEGERAREGGHEGEREGGREREREKERESTRGQGIRETKRERERARHVRERETCVRSTMEGARRGSHLAWIGVTPFMYTRDVSDSSRKHIHSAGCLLFHVCARVCEREWVCESV